MRPIIRLITISLTIFFFFSSPTQSYTNHSSLIIQWCKETPHPSTCAHYASRVSCPHPNGPTRRSEFRTMIVEAALERAVDLERRVYKLRSMARTHQQRVAWIDCMRLHLSTVRHLNRTLQGLMSAPKSCTDRDAQTWLSSSLTNLATCEAGFADLNVTGFLDPVTAGSNLTELLSNTLAVNNGLLTAEGDDEVAETEEEEEEEGAKFPKWFGPHEGRLVQGARPGLGNGELKGNLVVAQDGSGNFKTVQAAIDFAKRRKYRTRFVIRIKSGVYKENIEVDYDNSYIWLIGDGIRKTTITGDRSVGSGYNTVVAKDSSGMFKTVQAALDLAAKRDNCMEKFIIRVKKGVYDETIEVLDSNHNVWLVGDGIGVTIITGNRSVGSGNYTTFSSATAGIDGARFVARGITFRNTAGPQQKQAVALRSASDLAVFYQCSFQGYQDTLFIQTQRQFFRECHLSGTVDFIFGNAAAVFQNCLIFVRRPMDGQNNTITAQGRQNSFEHTGFSIHGSRILPSSELKPVASKFPTYLGRPWMRYSRTVIMKTYMDGIVSPEGWSTWGGTDFALNSLYFGEYNNTGAGASTKSRVRWRGFHVINDDVTAKQFTVNGLYAGRSWLPSTGVPFSGGL
ncbi:Probable pectinesterase/pectinesterase inhibitor 59 [Linum perenne]